MAVTMGGTPAREPDASGDAVASDGLRLYWEVHGAGSPTIVLLPANPISHSRLWKAQVHHLARHFRVVLYDGRGNGRSDHPDPALPYQHRWNVSDCLAVMDATATPAAVLVGLCGDGVWPSAQIGAEHPERALGLVALAPGVPMLTPSHPWMAAAGARFEEHIDAPVRWQKNNRRPILADHRGFLEFFFGEMFPEPHSTKPLEDAVAFGLDGRPEMLVMEDELGFATREEIEDVCRRVRCPALVIQGDRDNCQPFARGLRFAELTGAEHVRLEGAGHI